MSNLNSRYNHTRKQALTLLSNHLALEYRASQHYSHIGAILKLPTIALPGLAKRFTEQAKEELGHAQTLADFIAKYGMDYNVGVTGPSQIPADKYKGIKTFLTYIFDKSIELEVEVLNSFVTIFELNNPAITDYLGDWVREQEDEISEMTALKTKFLNASDPWTLDKSLD